MQIYGRGSVKATIPAALDLCEVFRGSKAFVMLDINVNYGPAQPKENCVFTKAKQFTLQSSTSRAERKKAVLMCKLQATAVVDHDNSSTPSPSPYAPNLPYSQLRSGFLLL